MDLQDAPQTQAVAGNWNDLFDDVEDSPSAGAHAGPELGDAAVQTEAEGAQAGCADGQSQALKNMEAELSRLQEANVALQAELSQGEPRLQKCSCQHLCLTTTADRLSCLADTI